MEQGLEHPFYWAAFIASGTGARKPLDLGPQKAAQAEARRFLLPLGGADPDPRAKEGLVALRLPDCGCPQHRRRRGCDGVFAEGRKRVLVQHDEGDA